MLEEFSQKEYNMERQGKKPLFILIQAKVH